MYHSEGIPLPVVVAAAGNDSRADMAIDAKWGSPFTNAALTGTMGEFETLYGAAEAYRDLLRGIEAVTPERVTEALVRWSAPDRAVRAWVGPDGA